MKTPQWMVSTKAVLLICTLCHVILILSYLGGFFSYDFFTLWGVHPKLIWTFGDVFLTGADTLLNFTYHTILGNIFGTGVLAFNPDEYPDHGWGIFITVLNHLLLALVCLKSNKPVNTFLFFTLILLLIPGTVLGQQMFGGYLDITCTLLFILGLIFHEEQKTIKTALIFALLILVKATFWPWIIIFLGAEALSDFRPKYQIKRLGLIALTCAFSLLIFKAWYAGSKTSSSLLFLGVELQNFDSIRMLKLILTPFTVFSGLLGILTIALIRYRSLLRREILFVLFGLLKVYLIYFFIIPPSEEGNFPSLKRYLMMLIIPTAFLVFSKLPLHQFRRYAVPIIIVFFLVRTGETVFSLQRNYSKFSLDLCERYSELCQKREQLPKIASGCQIVLLDSKWTQKELGNEQLPYLIFHYLNLPDRVVLNGADKISPRLQKKHCTQTEKMAGSANI